MNPVLLFHTVRHLRPVQIVGRLRFKFGSVAPDLRPAPLVRIASGKWLARTRPAASMIAPVRFRFLNVEGDLKSASDWNDGAHEKLWLYNLHYFDDLNAEGAEERRSWHRALISRWVEENPPGFGNGWEPYPVSLRTVNWIKWALSGNPLETSWLNSLAVQIRWLSRRVEWHLLGNHLFANAKALVFAGCFYDGPEADQWLRRGLEILDREIPEQILPDGGHFERSPMYHAIILADVLDLIQLSQRFPAVLDAERVSGWLEVAARMLRWLSMMTHPDGDIAFFNDAAFGIAPRFAALAMYGRELGVAIPGTDSSPVKQLADSGYVRMQFDDAVVIADVGEIGPDYLPGHAHADTLAFELSIGKHRVIVNGGTSVYGTSEERLRQRSTQAHSTVELNGENSSEVWSGFRVARRARPLGLRIDANRERVDLECAHDGYHRLAGRPTHHRRWSFSPRSLQVSDWLEGPFVSAAARYHLNPDIAVETVVEQMRLALPDGRKLAFKVSGGTARTVPSTWHPEFGISRPSRTLELTFETPRASLSMGWD